MGYYTEFDLKLPLRKDTPLEILDLIQNLCIGNFWEEPPIYQVNERPDLPIEHEFGKTTRWPQIFSNATFSNYILLVKGELKNYDNEIQKLIDWLKPYIKGRKKKQYLGKWRGEQDREFFNEYILR